MRARRQSLTSVPAANPDEELRRLKAEMDRLKAENDELQRKLARITAKSGVMVIHQQRAEQDRIRSSMRELLASIFRTLMGSHGHRRTLQNFFFATAASAVIPRSLGTAAIPPAPPPPPQLMAANTNRPSIMSSIAANKKAVLEAAKAKIAKELYEQLVPASDRDKIEADRPGMAVLEARIQKKSLEVTLNGENLSESEVLDRMKANFKASVEERKGGLDANMVDKVLTKMFKNSMLTPEGYETLKPEERLDKAIAQVQGHKKDLFPDSQEKILSHVIGEPLIDKLMTLRGEIWDVKSMAENTRHAPNLGTFTKANVKQMMDHIDQCKKDHAKDLRLCTEQAAYSENRIAKICKSRLERIKKSIGKTPVNHMSSVPAADITPDVEPEATAVTPTETATTTSTTPDVMPQANIEGAKSAANGWFGGWFSREKAGPEQSQQGR